MPVFNNALAGAAGSGGAAGYKIERSLRFNRDDDAYLSRTFAGGNRKTWTWSGWIKLGREQTGGSSNRYTLFECTDNFPASGNPYGMLNIVSGFLGFGEAAGGAYTAEQFRDHSAWYHVVAAMDTTQSTPADRLKLYVNGVQYAHTGYTFGPSADTAINQSGIQHNIGREENSGIFEADLLMAEVHFIDGQALDCTSFGEFDATTGVWNPIEYTHSAPTSTSAITNVSSVDNTRAISVTAAGWQQLNNAVDSSDSSVSPSNNNTPGTITFSPALVGVTKVRAKTRFYGGGTAKLYNGSTEVHSVNHNNNNATQYYTIYEGPPIEITQYWQQMNSSAASDDFWALEVNNTIVATTSNGNNLITSISGAANTLTTTDNSNYSSFSVGDFVNNGAQISAINSSTPSITVNAGSWSNGDAVTAANNSFYLNFSDNSTAAALGTDRSGLSNTWTVNNLTATAATANTSQIWSSTSNNYHSGAGNAFDGNLTTSSFASSGNNANAYVDITAINASKVEVYISAYGSSSAGGYYYCRQTDNTQHAYTISSSGTSLGWVTVYDGSQISINRLGGARNSSGAAGSAQYAWRVDGVLLVDNGTTGFDPSGIDSLLDSPTDYDDGTNVHGNYATLNPLDKHSDFTTSNGNLDVATTGSNWRSIRGTIGITSGKYYWEFTTGHQRATVGIATSETSVLDDYIGNNAYGWSYLYDGNKYHAGGITSYGNSYTNGDTIGVAFDADAGSIYFYKNGTIQNSGTAAYTGLTSGPYFPAFSFRDSGSTFTANFGQRPFKYTLPTGYKSLCTQNLPDPLIADGSDHFLAKAYSGNGSTQSITTGFSPDLVWLKSRDDGEHHGLFDTHRGALMRLASDYTYTSTSRANTLTSFNSNGFSLGSSGDYNGASNEAHIAWAWNGGDLATNSTYNQSQSWSSGGGSGLYSGSTWGPVFNGSPATSGSNIALSAYVTNSGTSTLTFATAISGTLKATVCQGSNTPGTGADRPTVTLSDGSVQYVAAANNSPEVINFGSVSNITTLTIAGTSAQGMNLIKLELDNKELVDAGVIPAGGLNSSIYNTSRTWSSGIANPSSDFDQAATNAFDGDRSTKLRTAGNSVLVTLNFSPALTVASTIEILGEDYASADFRYTVTVDGTTTTKDVNQGQPATFNVSGSLTQITVDNNVSGGRTYLEWIKVDGKELIDSNVTPPNVPSIASTVSANPTAGFSIVKYPGNGSTSSPTIAHGLNAKLGLVIIKNISGSQSYPDWYVKHKDIGDGYNIRLNLTASRESATGWYQGGIDNLTSSNVVSFVTGSQSSTGNVNTNGNDYIAYCFAPVEGYSAFGSYTGNGSDNGPFIYTGFRPQFVMTKGYSANSNNNTNWNMLDTSRNPGNEADEVLAANLPNVTLENTHTGIDILSNGFRLKNDTNGQSNYNGWDYIYVAFAENPFKYARAR